MNKFIDSIKVKVDSNLGINLPFIPKQSYTVYKSINCLYLTNLRNIKFNSNVKKIKEINTNYLNLKDIIDVVEGQLLIINSSNNILEIVF